MSATPDRVRSAFEDGGYEVLNVERNRSRYRVFLDESSVERSAVESLLDEAFGADAVFGTDLTDDMVEGADEPVRVVSFRLR